MYSLCDELYLKSLIPKGAKSTFVTSEKDVFLCASYAEFVHTSMGNLILKTYNIFILLALFGSEMRSKDRR